MPLGGASSGKSTFIKQLRIHHGDGFPVDERSKHTGDIYENVSDALNLVLDHVKKFEGQCNLKENEVRNWSIIGNMEFDSKL